MAASTPEELAVKRITVYFDTGQETLATNMVIPLGYLGGQPNRPGPWGIVVTLKPRVCTWKITELTTFKYRDQQLWFNQYGNITENMNQWLAANSYTWPLTAEQHTHFTLTWL